MLRRDILAGGAVAMAAGPTVAAAAVHPPLWRLRSRSADVFLFADGPPRKGPVRFPAIDAVAKASTVLWREVPPVPQDQGLAFVRQHGLDPTRPLTARVPPVLAERLPAAAEKAGAPMATLQMLRPWAAAQLLQSGYYPRVGLNNAYNDAGVTQAMQADGKPVRYEMGDAAGVLSYFSGMAAAAQTEFLGWAVADVLTPLEVWEQRTAAWDRGDLGPIERWIAGMQRDYPSLYATHVVERNRAWLPHIREMLRGRETTLVVFGAGHAVGPDSLLSMLAAEGLRARRI